MQKANEPADTWEDTVITLTVLWYIGIGCTSLSLRVEVSVLVKEEAHSTWEKQEQAKDALFPITAL